MKPAGGRWPAAGPLRLMSMVVLLVFAAVTVTASVVTRDVVRNQDQRILRERTAEVATLLGTAITSIEPSLQSLGTIARFDAGHAEAFAAAARAVSPTGSFLVLTQGPGGLSVTEAAGPGPAVGEVISGDRAQLARRALSAKGLVSGFVKDGGQTRLAIALAGAAGPGTVVWEESAISPATPVPSTASSPFRSLDIALYMATRPDPATLIVTTSKSLPLTGITINQRVPVGADTWLVVARSSSPLVGSLAWAMPWIVLALGLLAAGLTTTVVETLGRRRGYALALVAERTESLHAAVAELEGAQERLVRQERLAAVGELASSVSHELRNPLGVIMNAIYLIEKATESSGEPIRRYLATAKREVSAATLIVSDLLDFATARGQILAPVDVCELVTEALSVVPAPDDVEVVDHCAHGLVIDADGDQIRQVLLNLISNAYDAMPDGGTLTVTTGTLDGVAQITIRDTGLGMDQHTRDCIFTPFFTNKTRGIGLGLAVTKRIVEAHGGTIIVASEPSAGSSFTVTLPHVTAMASVTT